MYKQSMHNQSSVNCMICSFVFCKSMSERETEREREREMGEGRQTDIVIKVLRDAESSNISGRHNYYAFNALYLIV